MMKVKYMSVKIYFIGESVLGERLSKGLIFQIIAAIAILALPSLIHTGSYIIADAPAPKEGVEMPPEGLEKLSEGLFFIVIDGGRRDMMKDPNLMPTLNSRTSNNGTYIDVFTNPLTMTASCVKEMATGIPSRPNEGLSNFHPEHPGTPDGWSLASSYDGDNDGKADNEFAIVGDYVWGDLYADNDKINFMKHRYGHSDYMKGDEESFETINKWLDGEIPKSNTKVDIVFDKTPNVIVAHLSGLDSTGHRYGSKESPEYMDKLKWLDDNFAIIFEKVPKNWTVVVTSDHGLTDTGQHGSPDEIIREVGAWVWGPNIKEGYVVEKQIDQRDLATLPSLLLSLPLPHANHGIFPLDMLNVSQDNIQILEQWNWDATVQRNNWMEENGHPYVEGLTSETIQWEEISPEEMGIRNVDLLLSGLFFILICGSVMFLMSKNGFSNKITFRSGAALALIFSIVSFFAANRQTLVALFYPLGNIAPYSVAGLSLFLISTKSDNQKTINTCVCLLFASIAFMLSYVETRFSALGLLLLLMIGMPIFRSVDVKDKSTNVLKIFYIVAMIPIIFLSHYRAIGFSLPRIMIYFTFEQSIPAVLFGSALILISILLFMSRNQKINQTSHKATIAIMFTAIPTLISLESNFIDWILLSGLIISVLYASYLTLRKKDNAHDIFLYCTLFWLTMTWGGWACAATMIMYASIESFLGNELKFLTEKCQLLHKEIARNVIIALFPLVVWFTWWAALGQIDGFGHPRDVDPGNIFLNGGYIGDRFSPSNAWVGFMGAGATVAMSMMWWGLFNKMGWPVHYVALLLVTRISLISLQLSVSPNLPRLIFKISWDIIFALGLLGFMAHILLYNYLTNRKKPEVSQSL
ncbi:MAG: hypothetical protein DWB99_04985 [Candidatus Poseidoniales archaeon]|nr:MAG: hypothetical protein DWB99_04985 [Candidatus Poseidoniales archaeon]